MKLVGQIAGKITLKGRKISVPLGNRTQPNRSPGLQHNLSCDAVRTPGLGHKRPNQAKYDTPYAQQGRQAAKQTTMRSVQTVSDEDRFGLRDLRFSERCQQYRVVYCLCLQSTPTTVAGNKVGRQCTCNVTLRRVRATIVVVEQQQVLHILSVCLQPQVFSMQCACAILSYVACPALQCFSTLSHKRHDFW
jgi:hypothetical protein